MIPKPSACIGCPFYEYGEYFTPDYVVPGSEVYILAQNPGSDEEAGRKIIQRDYYGYNRYNDAYEQVTPQPLLGATGKLFNKDYLPKSGLTREEVSLGNAIRCRPGRELGLKTINDLPPITVKMKLESSKADIVKALKHCKEAYFHPPSSTKVVMTMGRHAMFVMTGIQNEDNEYGTKQGVVESWRGYAVNVANFNDNRTVDTSYYHDINIQENKIVFFTQHIAALFKSQRMKRYTHAVLQDFYKLRLILNGTWPHRLPEYTVGSPKVFPTYSCFDTEYIPDLDDQLTMYSVSDFHGNYYAVDLDEARPLQLESTPATVLIQNAVSSADLRHLANIIDTSQDIKVHDLMLADSVLWTGEPHNLNFIQSKVGSLNRHKHLSKDQPELYAVLDVHQPEYIWRTHHIPQFKKDQAAWNVYNNLRLPLIEPIRKSHEKGARVNTARLKEVQMILIEKLEAMQQEARELTGNPEFRLSARKEVLEEIYG